jgi:hypothetical protein
MKALKKFFFRVAKFFKGSPILKCGDSMNFLGCKYYQHPQVPCNINDKVIIHPTSHSEAKKAYPAKIVVEKIVGRDGRSFGLIWVLAVEGIEDNKDWKGAWLNDYLFSRLEFVSRNYKGE